MAKDKSMPDIDSVRSTAEKIFIDRTRFRGNFDPHQVAVESFRMATVFNEVAEEFILEPEKVIAKATPPQSKKISVPRMWCDSAGTWQPVLGPNMEPLHEVVMTDPHAYAPNLSDSNPINLRFDPPDHLRPSERRKGEGVTEQTVNARALEIAQKAKSGAN